MTQAKPSLCSFCKKEIEPGAIKCPHCQSDLRSWFSRHPLITILLILFVGIPTFFVIISPSDGKNPLDSKKEIVVERITRNLIKDNLKAPSTAEFGYPATETKDGKTFVVTQSVDSQNSFGAMLKSYYDVTIKYSGEDNASSIDNDSNWKVVKVESDGKVIYQAK